MSIFSRSLPIVLSAQRGSNLCWAEAVYTVGKFYERPQAGRFCHFLAEIIFPGMPCSCSERGPVTGTCNRGNSVEDPLDLIGLVHSPGFAGFGQVKTQIESGELFLSVRGLPRQTATHVAIAAGYVEYTKNGITWTGVEVFDPANGSTVSLVRSVDFEDEQNQGVRRIVSVSRPQGVAAIRPVRGRQWQLNDLRYLQTAGDFTGLTRMNINLRRGLHEFRQLSEIATSTDQFDFSDPGARTDQAEVPTSDENLPPAAFFELSRKVWDRGAFRDLPKIHWRAIAGATGSGGIVFTDLEVPGDRAEVARIRISPMDSTSLSAFQGLASQAVPTANSYFVDYEDLGLTALVRKFGDGDAQEEEAILIGADPTLGWHEPTDSGWLPLDRLEKALGARLQMLIDG